MDIFNKLQQQLDTYSLGFPSTESGIEISILKDLFSQKDAELFTQLTPRLETPEIIAQRLEAKIEDMAIELEDMASRGLLFRLKKDDSVKYGAIPFMHGIMEFQVKRFNKNLAQKMEQYFDEGFHDAIAKSADLFIHPIPVNESINLEQHIASYEDAREILKSIETIVISDCICRTEKGMLDKSCDSPVETCFMFGSMAKFYLDNNMGRQITAEEGIEILTKAQKAGLVTQPSTSLNPNGMCCCCGDCCGILLSLKKFPEPAKMVFSNHYAEVITDDCTSCESCIERCPMNALFMNDDGFAEVNLKRCIGCGVCVIGCPTEAIVLHRKDEAETRVPPENAAIQMMTMAKKRGVI
jgi:electron transport complex protein RnfB